MVSFLFRHFYSTQAPEVISLSAIGNSDLIDWYYSKLDLKYVYIHISIPFWSIYVYTYKLLKATTAIAERVKSTKIS